MAGATPLLYRGVSLRARILILGAHVAFKTQLLRWHRVKVFVLSPMGLMAGITVPLRYRLMDVFRKLCGAELFMTGITHLGHRF